MLLGRQITNTNIIPNQLERVSYKQSIYTFTCIEWLICPEGWVVNTLRPRQKGRHFPDDIFKCIFLNENSRISINISLKFVPKSLINNIPALVQIMAWRRPGDKPLSEPMMVRLPMHICITRPQWVKQIQSKQSIYVWINECKSLLRAVTVNISSMDYACTCYPYEFKQDYMYLWWMHILLRSVKNNRDCMYRWWMRILPTSMKQVEITYLDIGCTYYSGQI